MKKLDFYIAKQILIGFLLVTFSLMSILWLSQSLRFVELVTNKGLPTGLFIELTSLLMPRLFVILSPIALFISVLFVFNRLLSDRELVVMKAAGISPWQNARPVFIMGAIFILFSLYVSNIVIPRAEKAFAELEWKVKNDLSHLLFREGEFTTIQPNLTIFISKQEKDGSISGILINDERNPKTKVSITADKGRIVYTEDTPKIILIHGSRQEINKETFQFNSVAFDRYSINFGAQSLRQKKAFNVREQSLKTLLNALSDETLPKETARKYFIEGNKRILSAMHNILFALLGCAGLLVSNFNRRGQGKVVSFSVTLMILIQAGDLVFSNLAIKHLPNIALLYANFLLPLLACLFILTIYNPLAFRKKNKETREKLA